MKLYSIKTDWRYLIGNGDPQVTSLIDEKVAKDFTSGYPEINSPLKYELHKNGQESNCLSQSGIISRGFLIDDSVKAILNIHSIMRHKFYPVEILDDKRKIQSNYYWLQLEENLIDEIDFENSVFFETMYSCVEGEIRIDSFNHYKHLKEEKGIFWGGKGKDILLKKHSVLKELDLFHLFPLDGTICISERLRNAIEKANLTGFDIEEYGKIRFQ